MGAGVQSKGQLFSSDATVSQKVFCRIFRIRINWLYLLILKNKRYDKGI